MRSSSIVRTALAALFAAGASAGCSESAKNRGPEAGQRQGRPQAQAGSAREREQDWRAIPRQQVTGLRRKKHKAHVPRPVGFLVFRRQTGCRYPSTTSSFSASSLSAASSAAAAASAVVASRPSPRNSSSGQATKIELYVLIMHAHHHHEREQVHPLAAEGVEHDRHEEHRHRRQHRPAQGLVDAVVDHLRRQQRVLAADLADAGEVHDDLVHRVADQRQERRHRGQVDLEVLNAEVVEAAGSGAGSGRRRWPRA